MRSVPRREYDSLGTKDEREGEGGWGASVGNQQGHEIGDLPYKCSGGREDPAESPGPSQDAAHHKNDSAHYPEAYCVLSHTPTPRGFENNNPRRRRRSLS